MVQEPSHVKHLSLIHVCKIGLKELAKLLKNSFCLAIGRVLEYNHVPILDRERTSAARNCSTPDPSPQFSLEGAEFFLPCDWSDFGG
jgi:hypothetical protein